MYDNISEVATLAPFLSSYGPFVVPLLGAYLTILYLFSSVINVIRQKTKKGGITLSSLAGLAHQRRGSDTASDSSHGNAGQHVPYKPATYSADEMISRSKHFYEMVNGRRSVRFFSDKPVPAAVVDNIIRAAGTSPSGAHTEPWTFVVVSKASVKAQIRQIVEEEELLNYEKRMGKQWVSDLARFNTNWRKPYLEKAPYLVVVFKQVYGLSPDGSRKTHYYSEISVAIAVGLLLAAVQNAGLVTVTTTPMNAGTKLRHLLNRPENEKVQLLLPIGYAADDATVPNFERKPLEDIMIRV